MHRFGYGVGQKTMRTPKAATENTLVELTQGVKVKYNTSKNWQKNTFLHTDNIRSFFNFQFQSSSYISLLLFCYGSDAESKEKHGVWDLMPELTITSPQVYSRIDSNTFVYFLGGLECVGHSFAYVAHLPGALGIPMPESTLSPSQGLWIWPLVLL